jgi:putative transcriptional regulator
MAFLPQTALLQAALPANPEERPLRPLWPASCVAASSMGQPRFERTIILVIQHDASRAAGIVVNRPINETSIASVLQALGQKGGEISGAARVFSGGPVQPDVFVVHSAD